MEKTACIIHASYNDAARSFIATLDGYDGTPCSGVYGCLATGDDANAAVNNLTDMIEDNYFSFFESHTFEIQIIT